MLNKLKTLSIGKTLLIVSILIIGVSLLTSTIITYWRFSSTTDDLVETTSKEINKQILLNYENYMENIIDIAHFLELEVLSKTQNDTLDSLEDIFITSESIDQNILSIALFTNTGNPVAATVPHNYISGQIDGDRAFINALSDPTIFHFQRPTSDRINTASSETVIHMSKALKYYDEGQRVDGVLMMTLSMDNFIRLADMTNLGDQGHLVFMDEHGNLIYASNDACSSSACESITVARTLIIGGGPTILDGTSMYANVNTLNHTRWQMASFFDTSAITTTQQTVLYTVSVVFATTVVIAALLSSVASTRISYPLEKLKRHMQTFEKDTFLEPIEVRGQQEVVVLSESFNAMSGEIKRLMDKVYTEQRAKRKSQFIALQNQINPHFLYNTLDSILYLTEAEKNKEAGEMVAALSKFFRLSISSEKSVVSLSEELNHVDNYLKIQKIRYQNAFEYTIDVEETLLEEKVLKLSLQPLVENAINHGIDLEESTSHITISAYEREGYLCATVKNTGYGLSNDQIQTIQQSFEQPSINPSSIGLSNVYQRLKLHFGQRAELTIESEMDAYTIVILKTPMKGVE